MDPMKASTFRWLGVASAARKSAWQAGLTLAALCGPGANTGWTCPFCYAAAASVKADAASALRSGIVILLVPPLLIFGAIAAAAIRGRHRYQVAREQGEQLQAVQTESTVAEGDGAVNRC
jgi:hypothetical protein